MSRALRRARRPTSTSLADRLVEAGAAGARRARSDGEASRQGPYVRTGGGERGSRRTPVRVSSGATEAERRTETLLQGIRDVLDRLIDRLPVDDCRPAAAQPRRTARTTLGAPPRALSFPLGLPVSAASRRVPATGREPTAGGEHARPRRNSTTSSCSSRAPARPSISGPRPTCSGDRLADQPRGFRPYRGGPPRRAIGGRRVQRREIVGRLAPRRTECADTRDASVLSTGARSCSRQCWSSL